jgi:putative ATP-dependent endonuclease of OLD family
VTDADPPVTRGASWNEDTPVTEGSSFKLSDRSSKLVEIFVGHQTVQIFHSKITLEYDLAEAGDENAARMATVWEKCFDGVPGTFNSTRVIESGVDRHAKAMAAWRGICRARHTGSKAEFAQRLAAKIVEKDKDDQWVLAFDIPLYLEKAITYVVVSCKQSASIPGANNE